MATENKSEMYIRGYELFQKIHGKHSGEQMVQALEDICPDLIDQTYEWAFDGILARPGLDLLTREYLIIASCVTQGHLTRQLKAHIEGAINLGATKEQIVEVILQLTFYAGGAAVNNALMIAKEVFQEK